MSAVQPTDKSSASITADELSALRIFRDLSADKLTQIASVAKLTSLKAGEPLFHAGDAYRKAVFMVLRGQLEQMQKITLTIINGGKYQIVILVIQ